jgi:CBS domain-containing protein
MRDRGISSVFVIRSKQKQGTRQAEGVSGNYPIGIITERDILYRVLAENKSPYKVTIGDIMSSPIVAVDEGVSIKDAISLMRRKGMRRLLVTGTKKTLENTHLKSGETQIESKSVVPIGAVTLMSIVGNIPGESLELAEIESPNSQKLSQVIKIVCPYCESKFENKDDLSKHIDRIHLGSGLLEGDTRKW